MNSLIWRTTAILLHAAANFFLISFLFRYDITGSWIGFIGFIVLALVLLYLFIKHLISFLYFLKKIKS